MRLVPQPPLRGAPRIERLLYYRRNYVFNMLLVVPMLILVAVFVSSTMFVIGLVVGELLPLVGLSILRGIQRERNRSPHR
jgi:ABC-type methionine transport system permease subunit